MTPSIHAGSPWSSSGSIANFYFNGGTVKASASNANFMAIIHAIYGTGNVAFNAYITARGAIIDTTVSTRASMWTLYTILP